MTTFHPHKDNKGDPVLIRHPSTPTAADSWTTPEAAATVVPGGWMPAILNGVALTDWSDAPQSKPAWQSVEGIAAIDEPPFLRPQHLRAAAGVVVREDDGRYWLVAPSNTFGGYKATFPKGTVEEGMTLQATAIIEAYEEAALRVAITGFLADVPRSMSYTRYYLARRTGGNPASMGWESQAVHLVPASQLPMFLTNPNDAPLLAALSE